MKTKTLLSAATAAAALALAATVPAHAAGSLFVNYSDDASATIYANPGDVFSLGGFSGGVLLTDGVAQNVDVFGVSEYLGCCWDDQTYSTSVNHTLTLNGVGGGFSELWNVYDYYDPATDVSADGPVVFNVTGGTVTVSMNGGGGFGNYSANMLFQSGAPEPAAWALMLTGFLGAGVALRSQRRAATATA